MTQKRESLIHLDSTTYYHGCVRCVRYVRCVRRAYLCGEDSSSGQNYDHCKQWIVSRLRFLSYVYAIDICAYDLTSNYYHVVRHADKSRGLSWSNEEVCERWMPLDNKMLGHVSINIT